MGNIVNILSILLLTFCWFFIIKKLISGKRASVKTVTAKVIDKFEKNTVSHYPGFGEKSKFIIVFSAENKKLSFSVSAFSYANYQIGKTGMLQYRGNEIISFE